MIRKTVSKDVLMMLIIIDMSSSLDEDNGNV